MSEAVPKKILIAGYYGFKNTGDEAILSAMLSSLRAIRLELDFVVVSARPEETAAQHSVESILWIDLPAILEAVRACDLVILGGGGLFADYWGTYPETLLTSRHGNNSFYGGFPLLAKLNDKPCMIYSVGVGPLRSEEGQALTRMAFDLADLAIVRDDESRKLVESLGADCGVIRVSVDAAFNLPTPRQEPLAAFARIRAERDAPIIGACLRNWDVDISPEEWQRQVAAAFDQFIENHRVHMVFVPLQVLPEKDETNDLLVAEKVLALMHNSGSVTVARNNCSIDETAGLFAQCDLVVGMRLHSLIFALMEGVPSVGIVYDPKVRNTMSRLGMEQYAIDLAKLTSQNLYQTMGRAWNNRKQIRDELEDKVKELRSLAAEDARLAIRLLDKPYQGERGPTAMAHIKHLALKQTRMLAELAEKESVPQSDSEIINEFCELSIKPIIARVLNSKGAVIFLPSVGWNIHLAQRPHHLARELARQGYVAIFDCNNSNADDVDGFEEIEQNLFLFKGPEHLLHEIPDPVLWAFAYNYHHKDRYPALTCVVYDLIDDLGVFPYARDLLGSNHFRAVKEATVVTCVARRLHQEVIVNRSDALYLPNAVEYELFADTDAKVPDDPDIETLLQQQKPIAGYYGALANWFDYDLVGEVAQLREDWNFLLIGPEYDNSIHEKGRDMLNRYNVFWIGPREYSMLPGYLRLFDVATIPFQINHITSATSPLKLYEYFSAGKPVISTPIPECQAFPEVNIVRDAQEFSQALDRAREQGLDEAYRKRLRNLARRNTWNARVQVISDRLESGKERVSIRDKWKKTDRAFEMAWQQYVERKQAVIDLTAEVAEQQQAIESLSQQFNEQQEVVESLTQEANEQQQVIKSLETQLGHEQGELSKTTDALGSLQEHAEKLEVELHEKELSLQMLSGQLDSKEVELRKITSSLGWRLLSRYGRIKYRYLLPIYRLLRLAPKQTVAAPVEQSAHDAANTGTDSMRLSGKDSRQ